MAEPIKTGYQRLFEIRLLHHYWLDEGATAFDLIADQKKKDNRLLSYDRRAFLAVAPTAATTKALNGLGCVYKNTALGCVLAVPDKAVLPVEVGFDFVVTVPDPALMHYTVLTLRPQRIYEVYHQPEGKTYRYKENVPVLSNQTGAARGTGVNKALFLSREIPALAADDQVEALVREGTALVQLAGDQPNAGKQELHAQASNMPVFVHQGDLPAIVPPPGLVGAPARGISLSDDIPDSVFALIRIVAVRPDDGDFSIIGNNGRAKTPCPVFQVRFKNRATIWQYLNKNTGAVMSTEAKPLPLTHWGNAGTKQKPSAGLIKVVTIGTKITKLVSEIFV